MDLLTRVRLALFLKKADKALMLTYNTRDITYFSRYCMEDCCNKIRSAISEDTAAIFGSKKFQKVKYTLIQKTSSHYVYRRSVSFSKRLVTVSYFTMGEDIDEIWYIRFLDNGNFVIETIL